jgi:hypothetical protein
VVDFHRAGIDGRFQGVVRVREGGQGESHGDRDSSLRRGMLKTGRNRLGTGANGFEAFVRNAPPPADPDLKRYRFGNRSGTGLQKWGAGAGDGGDESPPNLPTPAIATCDRGRADLR